MRSLFSRKKRRNSSVRNKTILIMVVTLIPSILISTTAGIRLLNNSLEISRGSIQRISQGVTSQVKLLAQSAQQTLRTIALTTSVQELDIPSIRQYFRNLVNYHDQYATILAATPDGLVVASGIPYENYNLFDRDYFQEAIRTRRMVVGTQVTSRSTNLPIIPFAMPILDAVGNLKLVLVVALKVSSIGQILQPFALPEGAVLEVWDSNDTCLLRQPKVRPIQFGELGDPVLLDVFHRFGLSDPISTMLNDRSVLVKTEGIIIPPDPEYSFRVCIAIPAGIPFNSIMNILIFFVITLISLGFSLMMSSWLYRSSIGNRLDAITHELQFMADKQNLSRDASHRSEDEIDLLFRTFQHTSLVLQRREHERDEALQAIQASLAEKEVLLKEIHHRVKNNFQIISSLLSLQSMSVEDQNILRMFEESRNRILSMALIHERLYRSESFSNIDFGQYTQAMAEQVSMTYAETAERVSINYTLGKTPLPLEVAVPLGLVLNEALSNCFKHAFRGRESGTISIRLLPHGENRGLLEIEDDGVGLERPDQLSHTNTLGMELIQTLTKQINGTLTIKSPIDSGGMRLSISFPLPEKVEWSAPEQMA